MKYIPFKTESPIYKPEDIVQVLTMSVNDRMMVTKRENSESVKLYNVPAAFDIETTSFNLDDGSKAATMYEWTFGINGNVIIGRTWDKFFHMLDVISQCLNLSATKRLIIYVHNLSFEFQFMRKWLQWSKVFAIDTRKPVYAITESGIEFRCSYILSGYSLAYLGGELQRYPVKKMEGDLDYSLIRNSETPLTEKELKYCENDVRVVMSYIQERIEIDKGIQRIPLTKTGYVRNYCRNACLFDKKSHRKGDKKFNKYREMIKGLTLDVPEYKQLKRAFQGGFTHANAFYTNEEVLNVASYDFTSSYPYVMIADMFPMSKGKLVNGNGQLHSKDEFYGYLKRYCCLFDIMFTGIISKVNYENYISASKCKLVNPVVNNGRVVSADSLITTLTEQDFAIISKTYMWEKITIKNFRIYMKDYLPTDFVKAILKLYGDKTTLKGVKGKEVEYIAGKSMLNATYGMTVTDICRVENIYDSDLHEWDEEDPDVNEAIDKYNRNIRRFLFYPWGVWVTAYARRNLYTGIFEFENDYVYSDTDSVKVVNHEAHDSYIKAYNEQCRLKLQRACQYHGIPFESVEPCTIKGEKKLLGVWDFEGVYDRFKTLGAKRYMTEKDDSISLTVAGINKTAAIPYLLEKYGHDGIFEAFTDTLYVPAGNTGKNTHTYIDDEMEGTVTDYMGTVCPFHELSCVHLEESDYSLSMAITYLRYIMGVRTVER